MFTIKRCFLVMIQGILLSALSVLAAENIQFEKESITFASKADIDNGITVKCVNNG